MANIDAQLDTALLAIEDLTTVPAGIDAMAALWKQLYEDALADINIPAATQAKLDAIPAAIKAKHDAIAAAIVANTPAEPTP